MLTEIDAANAKLLKSIAPLTDDDMRQPSTLPGWTRGHVLSHLARGCTALANVLHDKPAYESQERRAEDIEAGSGRTADELRADVTSAGEKLRAEFAAFPPGRWDEQVSLPGQGMFPRSDLMLRRINEIELHLVDLAIGYTSADWSPFYAAYDLPEPLAGWRADRL
jgi:maleylpyruvate isomerase